MKNKIRTIDHVIRPSIVYVVLSITGLIIILLVACMSHGELINHYFFYDTTDTGMDFFNSTAVMRWKDTCEHYQNLYPPLANLFYKTIYHMIPLNLTQPLDELDVDPLETFSVLKGGQEDLRLFQAPVLLFLFVTILSVFFIYTLVLYTVGEKKQSLKVLIGFSTVFGFPFLYAYERGNIVTLCWCLTMLFLLLYDHKDGFLREIGLISLALAAGLKLYPAIYGVILLQEKRYKAAVRAIIYGILSVLLPMAVMGEGVEDFKLWIRQVMSSDLIQASQSFVISPKTILSGIDNVTSFYHLPSIPERIWRLTAWGIFVVLAFISVLSKEKWKRYLYITFSILMVFPQYEYAQCFFFIPLLFFFRDEDKFHRSNILYFICMAAFTINVPACDIPILLFWYRSNIFTIALQLLVLAIIWDSAKHAFKGTKHPAS